MEFSFAITLLELFPFATQTFRELSFRKEILASEIIRVCGNSNGFIYSKIFVILRIAKFKLAKLKLMA